MRTNLLLSFCLAATSTLFAADADDQHVSFDKPVEIPETVLQPGNYTIHLEDRMSDRAIVRISDASGTEHYLLTVPSKQLNTKAKGVIFFPAAADAEILRGWECQTCRQALELVYPKDEAVKLTAETGKPVLAYDASYDKLPANLSAADRKVVTLWMLAPKTVTAEGKGEGLTAAKYSQPKAMASAQPLPKTMPKTGSTAFLELILGFVSFLAGLAAFLWRKISALPKTWKMVGLTMIGGMVTGFALPIAASYQTARTYAPAPRAQTASVLEVPTLVDQSSEMERLKVRNRRLEALVTALRQK